MAKTAALDWGSSFSSQVLNRRSSGRKVRGGASLPQGALEAFQVGSLFVQIPHQSPFADVVEDRARCGELVLLLVLQIGQFQSLEDDGGQFFLRNFRFIDVFAGLVAGAGTLAGAGGRPAEDVAGPGRSVALADVGLFVPVEAEADFFQGADRHFHLLAVPVEDDRFFGDQIGEVFPDGLPNSFLVALLVQFAFAVKGPVLPGKEKQTLCRHGASLPWGQRLSRLPA